MATRRMIASDIWRDDFIGELSLFGRLLWVGLIVTCADDQGRLADNAKLIRTDVFPLDDFALSEIETELDNFSKAGKILRYEAGGKKLIQIVNWWDYQTPSWASASKYEPPQGWTDREKYHTTGNKVAMKDWDKPGGFATAPDNVDSKVGSGVPSAVGSGIEEGEVKGKGKGEEPPPPSDDPFDVLQRTAESKGIMLAGPDDITKLTALIQAGATKEDMEDGIAWKAANNGGKAIQYFSQIIGPTETAMRKRLQAAKPVMTAAAMGYTNAARTQ